MNILGISCFYHDAAAALIVDGKLVAASQEERFTRVKHDARFPEHAISYCMRVAGIRPKDIDVVAFYERPLLKLARTWKVLVSNFPKSHSIAGDILKRTCEEQLSVRQALRSKLRLRSAKIVFVPHHVSHAASAFLCSPFDDAAIVTIDGVGEWSTATMGHGKIDANGGASLSVEHEISFPHSVGLLYSAFTQFCGFEVNEGEYKLMGLAPYGEPRYVDKVRQVIDVADDGSFRLNLDYFSFLESKTRTFSPKFVELFGAPNPDKEEHIPQRYADIAASIQRVTEDTLLTIAKSAHKKTGSKNLCMAGGVALNSVANGRIAREGPFEGLYVQPASDDSGCALGAALYAGLIHHKQPKSFVMDHAYWGAEFSDNECGRRLKEAGATTEDLGGETQVAEQIAEAIDGGQVVGFMQGRAEWGPRALGARSIIADPRSPSMKDTINRMVKFREPFRPFAPAVLSEEAENYFDFKPSVDGLTARFMLTVHPYLPDKGDSMVATNHCGTGRLQLVDETAQPRYRRVIEAFNARTGVPGIINTSFNLRGEPVVNSPEDALKTFHNSGIDILVCGNNLVRKTVRQSKLHSAAGVSEIAASQDENVQAAYELVPHLRDYHNLPYSLQPYTTIAPQPGYESPALNIDIGGYRLSSLNGKSFDWREWREQERRGLVVGGSTAFGQGASADSKTIASELNGLGDTRYLNLGIPTGTSGQEAASCLPFIQLSDATVVVSGVNTLYTLLRFGDLSHLPYTPLLMAQLVSDLSHMRVQDVHKAAKGRFEGAVPVSGKLGTARKCSREEATEIALGHQARDLGVMSKLVADGAKLVFCAQPLSLRAKPELCEEEKKLHDLLIHTKNPELSETLSAMTEIWPDYTSALKDMCNRAGVQFVDLNQVPFEGWSFIDHVHLTDLGNRQVAEFIQREL